MFGNFMKHYLKVLWYVLLAFAVVFSLSFTAVSLYRNSQQFLINKTQNKIPPPVLSPSVKPSASSDIFVNGCKAGIAVTMDFYKEGTLDDMGMLWEHCDTMNADKKTADYLANFSSDEEKLIFSCGVGVGEAGNYFHNLEKIKTTGGEIERLGGLCLSAISNMGNKEHVPYDNNETIM